MKNKIAVGLSWSVVVAYYLLGVTGIVLQGLAGETWSEMAIPTLLFITIANGSWSILGAVIISRHPSNRIGWILSFTLFPIALEYFAAGYAAYSAVRLPQPLPGESLARTWMAAGGDGLPMLGFFLLILLFPDGKPVSLRLRPLIWIAIAAMYVGMAVLPFNPKPFSVAGLSSPFKLSTSDWNRIKPLFWIAMVTLVVVVAIAAISLVYRFRRSRGEERQQLKWFTYAMVFFPGMMPVAAYLVFREDTPPDLIAQMTNLISSLIIVGVGIATATAILKHRLYEIDIIIRRTLVYGVLTGGLLLIFLASVISIRAMIGAVTGQESPVAVLVSTLLVVGLFEPLRRRIQELIDRRFYRQRYNAEATLAAFASTLRNEINFETLTANLLSIVEDTMHPAHFSLWVNTQEGAKVVSGEDTEHFRAGRA